MKYPSYLTLICVLAVPATVMAQSSTYNQIVGADTYVSSGQPTVNFGSLGAMEIAAPTTAQARTEMSLMRFDASAMEASFNSAYGVGGWTVTGVTLSLFSNVSTAGQQAGNASFNKIAAGNFEFDLLSNNSWSETGITWSTMSSILPGTGNNTESLLGTFSWAADGSTSSTWTLNNTDPLLVSEIINGGQVSILGQPGSGSTVGYLFNTLLNNPGYLNVTVQAVPEPSSLALMAGAMGVIPLCGVFRKRVFGIRK